MVQAVVPVRACGFFGFWGCFRVRGYLGRGQGIVWSGLVVKIGYHARISRGSGVEGRGFSFFVF